MPRRPAESATESGTSFDQTLALDDQTFAQLVGELTPYDEYLSELDKVPVLRDPIAVSARILQPDFRQGQRRDVRKQAREDGYTARESQACDIETLYSEYAEPEPAKLAKPAKRAKPPVKRSKRRDRKKKK